MWIYPPVAHIPLFIGLRALRSSSVKEPSTTRVIAARAQSLVHRGLTSILPTRAIECFEAMSTASSMSLRTRGDRNPPAVSGLSPRNSAATSPGSATCWCASRRRKHRQHTGRSVAECRKAWP